jgi:histidine ammonia-lyase
MQQEHTQPTLKLRELSDMMYHPQEVQQLLDSSRKRIQKSRSYLESRLEERDEAIYGINTGFGFLCDRRIAKADLQQLQLNLIRSHACGQGEEVPEEIVRLMLLLKVKSLSLGFSGVRLETVERLLDFYNEDILPVVYTQGSLGASGDLAPLAHLTLPLIGEGEVRWKEQRMPAAQALQKLGWEPLQLEAKEGLALLNGTQFMGAYATYLVLQAQRLIALGPMPLPPSAWTLSMDEWMHFDPLLHAIRPHPGQLATAENLRNWLADSEIAVRPKAHVQDPYSFRCVPQVHGASRDCLAYVEQVVEREVNSATDNPNIFPDADQILSGGNFHGQPLALALDFLAIGLAELASISERRVFQLLSGSRGLPLFLVADPGLHSGLMIPQYVAAGMVSQNKQLCTPASVDSIPSSNNQEDHVSMGANAATQCYQVLQNLERVLAIELLTASQALHFRRPLKSSPRLEQLLQDYRKVVPFVEQDRFLHDDMERSVGFLREERLGER